MKLFLFSLALVLKSLWGIAQEDKLTVYLACDCDENYIQQELRYVDFVRDPQLAEVAIFINDIENGGGGRTYSLNVLGKKEFENQTYELTFEAGPTMTAAERREGILQKIKLAMVPYLLSSHRIDQIHLSEKENPSPEPQDRSVDDPWNRWVFEVYGEGAWEKESRQSETDLEFGFGGDHVTEDWRIRFNIEYNHAENTVSQEDGDFSRVRNRHFARGSMVKSLNQHWSTGVFLNADHNTYSNIKGAMEVYPAIEYNFYPYREVLKREITLAYKIGYSHRHYLEKTLYEKTAEGLFNHSLDFQVRFRRPWGDVSANLNASSFLHDLTKNRVEIRGQASIRIFKGFAVRLSTNMELIRDQLNLPAGNASLEDILLRQRQIATDFEMGVEMGLSYTFGSGFKQVINTRL